VSITAGEVAAATIAGSSEATSTGGGMARHASCSASLALYVRSRTVNAVVAVWRIPSTRSVIIA
jgi:hypothetical protein